MNAITEAKWIVVFSVALLAACGKTGESAQSPQVMSAVAAKQVDGMARETPDFATLHEGGKVFRENCAECHGRSGEGGANWKQRGADGKLPAPPLNGTGHAWHHPMAVLRHVIRTGSPRDSSGKPTGNMPAWKDKLSDQEIDAVIAWFQNRWPDQIYDAWSQGNHRAMMSRK